MLCDQARRLIPALIDGTLNERDAVEVRRHINRCQGCLDLYREYEQDVLAITEYSRRAPWIPVADDVIRQLPDRPSPWWGRLVAGGNQLATVAGVAIVVLVVVAGAWALREMAGSESEPTPETMIGVEDDQDTSLAPVVIDEDEIDQVIARLDELGLVYDLGVGAGNEAYSINYQRIAFDRHLTLVEYSMEAHEASEIRFQLRTDAGDGSSYTAQLAEGSTAEGWMVLGPVPRDATVAGISHDDQRGDGADTDVSVDLSAIPDGGTLEEYAVEEYNNGIEMCCLEIDRGAAISLLRWEYEVVDQGELVSANPDAESTDSDQDPTPPAPYPAVAVDDMPIAVLSNFFGLGEIEAGHQAVAVFDLPDSGELRVEYEHLTITEGWDDPDAQAETYAGPWTLRATLDEPQPVTEPGPTPEPTIPPDVAEEPTPEPEPTPVPDDDDPEEDSPSVLIYLIRDEEIGAVSRQIDDTPRVATAAMEHLLAGITEEESRFGFHTAIYEGAELNGISIHDGVATVDLSERFYSGGGSAAAIMRVAQVVFTLTQFETVDEVEFLVDGYPVEGAGDHGIIVDEPLTRDDFEDLSPAILIERPTPGTVVWDEIWLQGTSNTFEATMQIEIFDAAGELLYKDFATATSGTGERGTFDLSVSVEPTVEGMGSVVMFEYSARDGSRVNIVEVPVMFRQ